MNIKIRNYRGCASLDGTAAPVLLIAGPNGSGKSSAIEAIRAALLGKTLEGAHDALADLDATAELLWWLVDNGHGPKVEARGEAA